MLLVTTVVYGGDGEVEWDRLFWKVGVGLGLENTGTPIYPANLELISLHYTIIMMHHGFYYTMNRKK